jgi:predicted  nucleic acid-binding Zn-ribbon protein
VGAEHDALRRAETEVDSLRQGNTALQSALEHASRLMATARQDRAATHAELAQLRSENRELQLRLASAEPASVAQPPGFDVSSSDDVDDGGEEGEEGEQVSALAAALAAARERAARAEEGLQRARSDAAMLLAECR